MGSRASILVPNHSRMRSIYLRQKRGHTGAWMSDGRISVYGEGRHHKWARCQRKGVAGDNHLMFGLKRVCRELRIARQEG